MTASVRVVWVKEEIEEKSRFSPRKRHTNMSGKIRGGALRGFHEGLYGFQGGFPSPTEGAVSRFTSGERM